MAKSVFIYQFSFIVPQTGKYVYVFKCVKFLYLLRVSTFLHELGDWHAACALPFIGGWRWGGGGLGCRGRVSLRACGCLRFFTGLFSSSCGEVGPLAGHGKSLLPMTGQDLCVHIPAAASVGGALLIHCIVFHKTPHLYSDGRRVILQPLKWTRCIMKIFKHGIF